MCTRHHKNTTAINQYLFYGFQAQNELMNEWNEGKMI